MTANPSHLTTEAWAGANRALVAKAIAEFSHELLLVPTPDTGHFYTLGTGDGTRYRFRADRYALDHWTVEPESISRNRGDESLPIDAMDFILDFSGPLGIDDNVLPVYLEEISSTLAGSAYKRTRPSPSAAELVDADFQTIERSMTEGHPCFVANNGRIGFDPDDYTKFAPETGSGIRVVWIAVRRRHARLSTSLSSTAGDIIDAEFASCAHRLSEAGLDPDEYLPMPVHPWQWRNRIATTFAADIASRDIVYLGAGTHRYQPQQSIRTLFNVDAPRSCYVKTSLSIVNMGFMRGLSPTFMKATPAINDWVYSLLSDDDEIRRTGFSILREVAAIGYTNPYYARAADRSSGYHKMLSALWRESPVPGLEPGRQLATMTSLLHVDADGRPFVSALIDRSGVTPAQWLDTYLGAYLRPLVHCFFAHRLVFMPHGENLILVLSGGIPERVIMKDIGEEIAVLDADAELPVDVERIRAEVPDAKQALSIFTDVFDSFFRFLASLLSADGRLSEAAFWDAVARCIDDYQADHPDMADLFDRFDLFAPQFDRSCLNRLQLANNTQMVDLSDPAGGLKFAGVLTNPIAAFGRRRSATPPDSASHRTGEHLS
ncbi:IucA/IucC family protein [Spelaeicoccus albus]|uniref:Siderophore synthetase component n=1 Tax=Spelaeicoccus albus TaxID=1280376 RepID=A0A7Z0D3I9_9MICO|nr:IucA/IucC family siderophore biosynthesis protein [Spelaeicoccus albus]NYI68217.1 siderophore synthetase component [Spelaeicoccus albus]